MGNKGLSGLQEWQEGFEDSFDPAYDLAFIDGDKIVVVCQNHHWLSRVFEAPISAFTERK